VKTALRAFPVPLGHKVPLDHKDLPVKTALRAFPVPQDHKA
jgi:hypothetical protein